jgi:hypothetical protein
MKFRIFRTCVLGSLLFAMAPLALADEFNLGSLSFGDNSLGYHTASGTFLDKYNFVIPSLGDAGIGAGVLNFTLSNQPYFNIDNFSVALYSAADSLLGSQSGSSVDFQVSNLGAGSYYLSVTGLANGSNGGAYSGAVSLVPVPESNNWMMLIAGLGIVGWMASRRSAT